MKGKKVLIVGASGMVGSVVLQLCMNAPEVEKITSLVRRPSTVSHPKLEEVVQKDFTDYSTLDATLLKVDVCYFCIGAYTGQVDDHLFKEITVDYPVALAKAIKKYNPAVRFVLLSGGGADLTEKSRMSFARYKGMAENQLYQLLTNAYAVRPGYIYPVAKRKEPNLMYRISRSLYPLIRLMGKNASIRSTELAEVMFMIGMGAASNKIMENAMMIDFLQKKETHT